MARDAWLSLPAIAIVAIASCSRPNLQSTGGGYGPAATMDTTPPPSEPAIPGGTAASDTAPGS